MPNITKHALKVLTRLLYSSARESLWERLHQDRQTDGHTDKRVVHNHFSQRFEGCTSQSRSYLELNFLHDDNTSIDMEVKWLEETVMGHGGIGLVQARFLHRIGY